VHAANRRDHWNNVFRTKRENEVSWFEESPDVSLGLIKDCGLEIGAAIIDIGGGASRLVDALVAHGYQDITVLDISEAALSVARNRLGDLAERVNWIVADITAWKPAGTYNLWHDRAAFHFLTEPEERAAYIERLMIALRPGGHIIIGTFALDGPERCSGLPVVRYNAESLGKTLGDAFEHVETRRHAHRTPMGGLQNFQFSRFLRRPNKS
jgi:SAM-dependent methyltransferase